MSKLNLQSQKLCLRLGLALALLATIAAAGLMRSGQAASSAQRGSSVDGQSVTPASADTCAAATVINPAALPFSEDSTLAFAANDIDPGPGGCVLGAGPDVVYSFTPAATDTYTIGATPIPVYDLSLYIVTDCSNPAGTCVAGKNARGAGSGEFLSVVLNAGTRYFIVVDTPTADNVAAGFHFSLRRGIPANDTCATATVIEPSRLPFLASSTTFGANNDLDPVGLCFGSPQSTKGPDVVFQFTPAFTDLYVITVTPSGHYDTSLYLTTNCSTVSDCVGADVGGGGSPETIRKTLLAGTTYFFVVDGFGGDAGDFTFSVVPSITHAPDPPSNLTATAISSSEIDLAWQDNSVDEQGFRIERSLDGFSFSEIATVGPNVTTYKDTGLTENTFYFYRVSAFNNFGTSNPSNIAFAQTPVNPVPVNPVMVVAPTSINFGSVRVTQSDTRTVTITNAGQANLIISAISDPASPFSLVNKPALPLTIATAQSVTLTVRFAPIFTGPVSSSFTIQGNDPLAPFRTVTLSGNGVGAPVPNLEISPASIDFGTSITPKTLTLKNTGEADLLISSILPPSSPFALSGSVIGVLKTGETRTLTVTFTPPSVGVFTGGFTIISNDPDSLLLFVPIRAISVTQVAVPNVTGLVFKKKGLRFQSSGSNVVTGAVLIVDGTQTFTLDEGDGLWLVLKSTKSTPGSLRIIDIFTPGSSHSVVVKNPSGATSSPVTISG